MKIVFMGTPDFAVPSLELLIADGYAIAAVVTQPDRPRGRKRVLTAPPVKDVALAHGIPVLQPEKLRDPAAVEALRLFDPDLIVTAAYGQILPKSVLALPRLGCINVHASLLPRYRGAAPIQYALMNGERETGVTIMYMAEGLDTGDMISRVTVPIADEDDTGTLFAKLSEAGAQLLRRTVPEIAAGNVQATPQDDAAATYARMLTREHERIDWSQSATQVHNLVRALRPTPGAFTLWQGDVLKIWRTDVSTDTNEADRFAPGSIVAIADDGVAVQCGNGVLVIKELQPAGKTTMAANSWFRGGRVQAGMRFGEGEAR